MRGYYISLHAALLIPYESYAWVSRLKFRRTSRLEAAPLPPGSGLLPVSGSDDGDLSDPESLTKNEDLRKLLRRRRGDRGDRHIWNVRVAGLPLNRTGVGPSRVEHAGRGLFCTRGCRKGDVLTCYPGDGLIRNDDFDADILWGDHVQDDDRAILDEDDLDGYILQASDDFSIVGHPEQDHDPAYLGHLANDGARPRCGASGIAEYVLSSNDLANAMHIPWTDETHMVTVATRDIQPGEEVLVTYGPDYWMEHRLVRDSILDGDRDGAFGSSSSSKTSGSGKGFG